MAGRSFLRVVGLLAVAVLLISGCRLEDRVTYLASDELNGRENDTPGGIAAREFIIDELVAAGVPGALPGEGDAAYTQPFVGTLFGEPVPGVNVLGKIEGTVRPDEYVVVGAHYDGFAGCQVTPADQICNAATDNATSVGIVLGLAERYAQTPPHRSIIFALWDAEEDYMRGSEHFVKNPIVPLADIVAYINFDIQGIRLLPSLATTTFALGAETGGPDLAAAVDTAYEWSVLDGIRLSSAFGAERSDHYWFLSRQVPSVFFTDSSGPCYHQAGDDISVVDWTKLRGQLNAAHLTVSSLVFGSASGEFLEPAWTAAPTMVFADAVGFFTALDRALADLDRFPPATQNTMLAHHATLSAIVDAGPGAFDGAAQTAVVQAASYLVTALTYGACEGFLN